jgi:hypothetical protein
MEWEYLLAIHLSDKGLASNMYWEFKQHNSMKTKIFKMGKRPCVVFLFCFVLGEWFAMYDMYLKKQLEGRKVYFGS